MTDRTNDHASHDRILIAAWAAGDGTAAERHAAASLAATCTDCDMLARDLRAIATATAGLPAPARRREFTLRPEDAARARRRGWRTWLRLLGGPQFDVARPIAAGLTTLGLAGLLVAGVPSLGGSAAGPAMGDRLGTVQVDNQALPSAAPEGDPVPAYGAGGGPVASEAPYGPELQGEVGDGREDSDPPAGGKDGNPSAARSPRAASPLAVLSGSFLIVGVGLFGLRWTARRLGDG